MKKLIYLFILTFGIISCSSDDETGIDNSELIGKWNWISSCGGFTGDCWYPSEDNYESVEFTNDLYIKKNNGSVKIIPFVKGYSTTNIIQRITDR